MEYKRKKWTPNEDVTPALIRFREKRKWQIALRRYIIEQRPTYDYAPYFGLDIPNFRNWIEIQFTEDLDWSNFATKWQFDHIIPVAYFNFENEFELKLCWNFINLRVEKIEDNKNRGNRVDVLAVKVYYENLYKQTKLEQCLKMLTKIEHLEVSDILSSSAQEQFIKEKMAEINAFSSFEAVDFDRVNKGERLSDLLLEKEMIRKFG